MVCHDRPLEVVNMVCHDRPLEVVNMVCLVYTLFSLYCSSKKSKLAILPIVICLLLDM